MHGMTISAPDLTIPAAVSVAIRDDAVVVELADGRTISAPLAWYPRLVHASEVERQNVRLIGGGSGLHWPDVEEDISIESIIRGRPSAESPASLKRWLGNRANLP
jgi:hypothetical protein